MKHSIGVFRRLFVIEGGLSLTLACHVPVGLGTSSFQSFHENLLDVVLCRTLYGEWLNCERFHKSEAPLSLPLGCTENGLEWLIYSGVAVENRVGTRVWE